jgi:hypothetical protein
VDIAFSESGTEIVTVDIEGKGRNRIEIVNSALLDCLTECGSRHASIVGLDMPAKLDPKLSLFVEAQEDVFEVGSEDEATRGEVRPAGFTVKGSRPAQREKIEIFLAKHVLPARDRSPGTEIAFNAHSSTAPSHPGRRYSVNFFPASTRMI